MLIEILYLHCQTDPKTGNNEYLKAFQGLYDGFATS